MSQITSAPRVGSLAAEVTTFVGRRREVAEVKRLFSLSRLVTLTGTGGAGKTRLGLRAAAEMARDLRDGVWFVDLAPLEDKGLLTQTVASALGLRDRDAGWQVSLIVDFLREKRALLILDNCEHLRDACAVLVDTLLRQAPDLRVLATSRQTLGLTAEHVFHVPPMSLPEEGLAVSVEAVGHYEAVTLFLERAQAVRPSFELTDANVNDVISVCRRLDGIPLAIELAAARLRALSVRDLLERLEQRFNVLVGGSVAAPSRHQTLRELIAWSWDLCSELEQSLWARASVFPSHFDLQAAESVCAEGPITERSVPNLLADLVEKTIVTAYEDGGRIRYRMLETLREFGREKLAEADEEMAARDRHRSHYRELASDARRDWFSPRQAEWMDRLRPEHSNLRVALDTSFDRQETVDSGLEMVWDLWFYWIGIGRTTEARRWIERGLGTAPVPTPAHTRGLLTSAYLCIMQEDLDTANRLLDRARSAAAGEQDPRNMAWVDQIQGLAIMSAGDLKGSRPLFEAALEAHRANQDFHGFMDSSFCLAAVSALQGDLTSTEALCAEAIKTCDEQGESWCKSYMLWCLGFAYFRRGSASEATSHTREALRVGQRLNEPWTIACCFELLAWTAAATDASRAARLLGAADAIWGRTGVSLFGIQDLTHYHDQCLLALREKIDDEHLTSIMKDGAALTLDQAIAEALGEVSVAPVGQRVTSEALPSLTKRESEVANLVAQGLTNKEIAARLGVAQRTAEGHIERILNKLGFTSRAQVAAWVVEHKGPQS